MNVQLSPSTLSGAVPAIASKSDVHRLLFCAAQADAPVTIEMNSTSPLSEDVRATVQALRQMGAGILYEPGRFTVTPFTTVPDAPRFDCGESGSTLRFLLPLAAARCDRPSFTGSGRLPERPIAELLGAMKENGAAASSDKLPFTFESRLHSGAFSLAGNVSSQFISGLLLGLPSLDGDSEIRLTTPLQSASYVNITLHALSRFGIRTSVLPRGFHIPGGQIFQSPGTLTADGDWSNAAFFLVAGAIGPGPVTVTGLSPDSPQGDKQIIDLLRGGFGANVRKTPCEDGTFGYTVSRPAGLRGCLIDLTDIPDAFPALAVLACFADGPTEFHGGERLRLKESDRIAAVAALIRGLGGACEEKDNGMIVLGKDVTGGLTGGTVDGFRDHRIVMAAAIAASGCRDDVFLTGADAVRKSYPSFFEDLRSIGGIAHVI